VTNITRVERPLEDLAALFGHRPADWLGSFASIAVHAGEAAAGRVGHGVSSASRRAKHVTAGLSDLPPEDDFARVDVAITVRSSGFRWAFPSFEGRITAVQDTETACLVTLEGEFELPAGASSEQGRRAAAVAAETATSMLLSTLRAAVEEQVRSNA
jgi:hypothetical protein